MNILMRYPGFRWIWSGQLLSQLGNAMFTILGLWEIQLKSPFLLSVAGLVMTVPGFLGMVGGVFVDRYDPRKIMLATDILRGGAVLAGLLALVDPHTLIWVIIVLLGINQLGTAIFAPAEMVIVPELVQPSDLTQANGLYSLTSQLASAVGAAIGGAAVVALGIGLIFGLDMTSFWLSALSIALMMRVVARPRRVPAAEDGASLQSGFLGSLREGMQGFSRIPILGRLLPLIVLTNFSFMAAFTMMPFWIRHELHATAFWYGMVDASWAAGLVLGGIFSGYFSRWPIKSVAAWLSLTMAILVVGFAVSRSAAISAVILLLTGLANGVVNAVVLTLLQRIVPQDLQGRVFGLVMTLFGLANPLGSLAAGALLHVLPLYWSWALAAVSDAVLAFALARVRGNFEDGMAREVPMVNVE